MANESSEDNIVRIHKDDLPRTSPEELERLRQMPDEAIDFSDIPEQDVSQYTRAGGEQINLHVDGDVLAWFRSFGSDYHDRMRQALRAFMQQQMQASQQQQEELVELRPASGKGQAQRYVMRRIKRESA